MQNILSEVAELARYYYQLTRLLHPLEEPIPERFRNIDWGIPPRPPVLTRQNACGGEVPTKEAIIAQVRANIRAVEVDLARDEANFLRALTVDAVARRSPGLLAWWRARRG